MGAKDSKPSCITYEDAVKRVSEAELKRLREAFKKLAGLNSYITKHAFIRDVLGDGVPATVAEHIFLACGGTQKGITFSNLLCGLVLLTKGREEEKMKFLFNLYSNENGSHITREDMMRLVAASELGGKVPDSVAGLFAQENRVNYEQFRDWLLMNPNATVLSRWLLVEPCSAASSAASTPMPLQDSDTPTFYQTLAGVTHLEEREIHWLEQRYWALQTASPTGQLDLETMRPLLCPPVPLSASQGLFQAFDQNHDLHVDFKEMACGISAACRGPLAERHKFCFKVFDKDHDGRLVVEELQHMAEVLLLVRAESNMTPCLDQQEIQLNDVESVLADVQRQVPDCMERGITVEEYLMWAMDNPLTTRFLQLIFQVCHIVLGLRPTTREEEGGVVFGWLQREERRGLCPGQLWYLVASDWWFMWQDYVNAAPPLVRGGSVPRLAKRSLDGSIEIPTIDNNEAIRAASRTVNMSPRKAASSSALSMLDTTNGSSSPSQSPLALRRLPTSSSPSALAPRPGAIDNSPLVITPVAGKVTSLTAEGGKLRRTVVLTRGRDFQLLPQALWRAILQWYGGAPALPRQVILPRGSQQPELELYPVTLRILRHQPQTAARPATQPGSWSDVVGGYGAAALSSTGYAYVPQITAPKRYLAYMAAFSRMASVRQVYDFLCTTLRLRAEDIRLWHVKDENNMTLLEEEEPTLEELFIVDDDQILLEVRNKDLTWPEEIGSLQQQDKRRQAPTEKGATGLNNLGNTCFMNAALQCVSNTRALTQYFTSNMHLYELNRTNPLGMKGHIAKKYGELIHDIWSGTAKTIAPLKLRWTIGKYAPRFTGFQQHDSQELLAFLLDGLHEDLNRVHDKPYVELKDSGGRPDVEVAQEAWENHILRNKSVVVDLFHGQLKSKVQCTACSHESVRFDPFNYLSLPLPMESCVHLEAIVVRLDGSVPVKYGLRLNMDEKYSAVKEHLAQLSGLPACRLHLAEVAGSQIKCSVYDSHKIRSHLGNSLYAYELPATLAVPEVEDYDMEDVEERGGSSSLGSLGSRSSEAQTFTRIQRMNRPPADIYHHPALPLNGIALHTPALVGGATQNNGVTLPAAASQSVEGENGDAASAMVQRTRQESESRPESSPDSAICRMSPESQVGSDTKNVSDTQMGCSTSSRGRSSPTPSLGAGSLGAGSSRSDSSASSHHLACSVDCSHRPNFIVALHRKMIRQEVYFVSWQRTQPSLFGLPLLVPCGPGTTHQALYEAVWRQVARLVSPLPPSSAPNHAMDCDDSLGYEFPFILKAVAPGGIQCAWCPWYRFCRGCRIQCSDLEFNSSETHLAVDWDPTALHLRYQNSKERVFVEHESVATARQRQSEPIGLAHCLEAFTREEQLGEDEKYSCPTCRELQPATKKLQIWRLPPILIVHLKRFQYVCGKWVKSQKVVEFPRKSFDPTDYLASVPRETLLRHADLIGDSALDGEGVTNGYAPRPRERVESTSLATTPVVDGALQDFHQHRLVEGSDPFRLTYNLYAIVCHSGILGGGHYVSYACNPNGKWYCYNDSSCKEVSESQIDASSAYMLFYERKNLSHAQYMPNVEGKIADTSNLDDDLDSDLRKVCTLA